MLKCDIKQQFTTTTGTTKSHMYEYLSIFRAYCSHIDIRSFTWDEWSYPEGVILPIVTLGTIRPEDSGAARNATEFHY